MKPLKLFLSLICLQTASLLTAQPAENDMAQLYPEFQRYADTRSGSLSYLEKDWPEMEQWKILARAKMNEVLGYSPDPVALEPVILEETKKKGYTRLKVRYSLTPFRKTEAYLLIPDGLTRSAPAVIALHDHGGFYYFGKEKIVETENQPEVLKEFIEQLYGGRPYADELARRGFVVLCPDAFYFGSQRIDLDLLSEYFKSGYPDINSPDINTAVKAKNKVYSSYEHAMAKYLFGSGTTWPGVMFHGDRIAVDYLLTRPEVDPSRIACVGLSIGGFRSAHLFGLDPRVSACIDAGWMTSYSMQMKDHFRHHTWMIYVPRQTEFLDLPDVASLGVPGPLMIINCLQDRLYTIDAMKASAEKIERIYSKAGAAGRYETKWYDVPHSFTPEMQDYAIDWLEKWLK
ncbi:MAG TPA: alpha/beta hydrolase family protein [Bacteroidales bacterium]|nr:alpha/beta hydrolase family protein [Bacteroidales bacterium]